jgi:hypothetical protein
MGWEEEEAGEIVGYMVGRVDGLVLYEVVLIFIVCMG